MLEDAIKWNEKHLQHPMPQTPSSLLVEFLPTLLSLDGRKALDIACGNGRNSKFLAENGFLVDSVDISYVALSLFSHFPNITAYQKDLDIYRPKSNTYDVIANFYFLNRDLFPSILKALKPHAIFLLETFIKEPNGENTSAIIDEKILNDGELESIFKDFKILHHQTSYIIRREGKEAKIISFVAQKQ
ncbi:methyltransferase domain-containing protein [Helicobacter cholecystus]|uniref:Methyltransferase domain-containing protein n=1 Tax=Helicobacter cholecystus TaxID=45498 RepID=A0A3D8IWB0_9HELI|nr:methyltransferase domain-containing protein [Helicobacter cholecystus]RDU69522.1 methyltransferase domain-containing protein [Helicobacter cholecystus]VEJ24076.1 telleurite resistance protein TehB [Helicobacter cholecystus]